MSSVFSERATYRLSRSLFAIMLFYPFYVFAQTTPKTINLNKRINKVSHENIFRDSTYYTWCSSLVKGKDGQYHLFYSRWPRALGFGSWLTHSQIAHAVSVKPAGPYKHVGIVLEGRGDSHWDAITAHNPKIKYFNGKYYLYYISTNYGDNQLSEAVLKEVSRQGLDQPIRNALRRNQRTGVAVAGSLDGPWLRGDTPLIEPSGPITTLTVNPAVTQGRDGRFYMIVKGDKPGETRFIRNQAMAISDHPDGPYQMQPEPVIGDLDTEDVSMWYSKSDSLFYAVFHAHTHIGMIASTNGTHWEKVKDYQVIDKKIPVLDGSTIIPDRMERPFVYVENDTPLVLSLGIKKGDDAYIVFIPLDKKEK
jgi:alpha-L-fucosidase